MLRENRGRAQTARIVFLLFALCSAAIMLLAVIAPVQAAGNPGSSAAVLYGLLGLSGIAYVGLLVASYVVLIMWLRRAYYNLHQLPNVYPKYSDGWAAGAWFVPFINLSRPYTIMREVWLDTQRAAEVQLVQPATILGWWWATFLLKFVIGRITWAMTRSTGSELGQTDLAATALDAGAQLLTALFTWYVIGRIARFEEQLSVRQQLNQLGQPAASVPNTLATEQSDYGQTEGY